MHRALDSAGIIGFVTGHTEHGDGLFYRLPWLEDQKLLVDPFLDHLRNEVSPPFPAAEPLRVAIHLGDLRDRRPQQRSLRALKALTRAGHLDQIFAEGTPAVAAFVSDTFLTHTGLVPPEHAQRVVVDRDPDVPMAWLRILPARQHVAEATSPILSLAVSPDGLQVVTGHADSLVRRWDTVTGARIGKPLTGHTGAVRAIVYSSDGREFYSSGDDGAVALGSSNAFQLLKEPGLGSVLSLAVDPSTGLVITGDADGMIRTVNRGDHVKVGRFPTRQGGSVTALAVSHDGGQVFSASGDGHLFLWQVTASEREVDVRRHDEKSPVHALALSPNGRHLVAGGEAGTILIWDFVAHVPVEEIETGEDAILSLAVTPDGEQIVSGHRNGVMRRWDAVSGAPISPAPAGHVGDVHALAVTPDERQVILSGGTDGVLRRWDSRTGDPIFGTARMSEHLAGVVSDLESAEDALGITGDVHTIAAVLAALSTVPPLSVALLGDWGAGKSSFMRQLRGRMEHLSRSSARLGPGTAFAGSLRQVSFNAWHYSDDHLWVGIVEHLFRELASAPGEEPDAARISELEARLAGEDAERQRLEHDLAVVQRSDARPGRLLTPVRSAIVFRAAVRAGWRDLRDWRVWVGLLILAAGVGAALLGQVWIGAAGAVLGTLLPVLSHIGAGVESTREWLVARHAAVERDIRATTDELDELDPARRLQRLLTEIAREERYATFRGLTGRIHHDLRGLSEGLAAARDRWERDGRAGPPPLQRIVLYVDDLDRCSHERVVEVLQAVNLLLTMDLFMVVVAVDPRWLLTSLGRHHEAPVAYLDKIFHIPFALRPMGDHAVGFLRSLLPVEPEERAEAGTPAARRPETESTPPVRRAPSGVGRPPKPDAVPSATIAEGLRVTATEQEFLGRLTPLLPTPRAVKKLTNLYRILRLSVPRSELPDFLAGPYQAAALLLAALAGAPGETRELIIDLTNASEAHVADVFKGQETPLGDRLAELVREDVYSDTATYRRWAIEVARFGFETYDLYTGQAAGGAVGRDSARGSCSPPSASG